MKKKVLALLMAALITLTLTACSGARYRDGVYSAQAAEFASSGWKEVVEITVEDGELVKINWDAIYKDDSIPIRKKQYSKSGLYGMMAAGSISEWYDQAIAAEQFVLENGIEAFSINSDGYADGVSGCTIHVTEFIALLEHCMDQAKR